MTPTVDLLLRLTDQAEALLYRATTIALTIYVALVGAMLGVALAVLWGAL
ncbi:hypothetical protein RHODGE_RHODGE_03298 [Rhodoplanes serenus]|uniref:Uncharacterized protein n=1 Tax=Rhodoplanes serenus TaxID=200615 RepID=A0A447CXQ0_9BRAD|nr:hypothetical protein [Rhodoplanes serenus]VCU10112.1 hypothetical protein RHODGE_RHODGE_03298 [Rhodoplanes serenus]